MPRPAFCVIASPDPELVKRRVASWAQEHDFAPKAYFGDDELPGAFWQDLSSPGLLGGNKMVVLRRAQALKKDQWEELAPPVLSAGGSIWPVICLEVPWERNQPKIPAVIAKSRIVAAAKKKKWFFPLPGLNQKSLPDFVSSWLRDNGLAASPPLLQALCSRLPTDAASLENELAKLKLATGEGGEIAEQDLELVNPAGEMGFFEFIDALQSSGRSSGQARVWAEVARMGAETGFLFQLLAMLQSDARIFWMLGHGEADKVRQAPWLKDKKARVAARLSDADHAAIWSLCLEADLGVKSGRKSEEQALEALIAGLTGIFGRGTAPGGRRP